MFLRILRWISGYEPITNLIQIYWKGRLVGQDESGNRYFRERGKPSSPIGFGRERRWVIYGAGGNDGSRVPPDWHAWLHHTCFDPPLLVTSHPWRLPHQPNMTGAPQAYRPPGHLLSGRARDGSVGDYESWRP